MNWTTEGNDSLGAALKAARKAANLNQSAVAEYVRRSQPWVSRIEQDHGRPTPNELDLLLELYKPTDDLRMIIERLSTPAPADTERNSRLDAKFLRLRNLELSAEEALVFNSERLPMSLQSEQYMLLQYNIAGYTDSLRDLLAERRKRQQIFTEGEPGRYKVILAESALYRMPGGKVDLIEDQATYLLELIDNCPGLRLQVLRFNANLAYVAADQIIVRLRDGAMKAAAPSGGTVRMFAGVEVASSLAYWHAASNAALDVDNSRKFIHLLAKNGVSSLGQELVTHTRNP